MIKISETWLGTPKSLFDVLYVNDLYLSDPAKFPPSLLAGQAEEDEEDRAFRMIEVVENVGILNISGPMVSEESWLTEIFGIAAYPAIGRAAVKLADMKDAGEIDQIIHVFNTPGGDAEGINSLTETLQAVKVVAPDTISYTASSMLSAGYWLGTINDKVYADKMAQVGSVGAISSVRSVARMLKEDGVDAKVYRSGKYKSPFHPYEKISSLADETMQKQTETLHRFFVEHVTTVRPALREVALQDWAEGQVLFAEEASRLGMIDGPPTTLTRLLNHFIGTRQQTTYTYGETMGKRYTFQNEADRAKVASGVPLSQVPHRVEEVPDTPEAEKTVSVEEPKTEASEVVGTVTVEPAADDALTVYLRDQVKELQGALKEAERGREQAEAKLQAAQDVELRLAPIVIEATHRLQVGLGQTPTPLDGLPASTLAEQYNRVKKAFEAAMPVGYHAESGALDGREAQDIGEARLRLIKQ